MKLITFDDIERLNLPKSSFYDLAKETLLFKDKCVLPAKTSMKWYNGEGFVNVMPTILPDKDVYGVKVVTRNPDATPTLKSDILLYKLSTSELLSVMDADYITAFRTGACAAVAIETLAVKNYSTIGLIGLGNICRATLLVLLDVVKTRKLTLKLFMYKNTDNGLSDLLKDYKNVVIEKYDNFEDVVRGSDVVISCVTYAGSDLAKPDWFKPGALLVPVHTRGFLNCDLEFDRIIIDDHAHVCGFKNYANFKNCHELTEVLKNPKLGRNSNEERIIAYNVGIAILDISFASYFYNQIKETDIILNQNAKKLWVK